jgi:dienelactone hydrolase
MEYFRRTTARLAEASLADVNTLDDWLRQRTVLRNQLLEMLGLWPLPERTDLHATVTGTIERDDLDFVVEKLHFQSRPGLYVTANFYRPKVVDKPLPTILYLCGHGNVKIDGVSYGSKASYQHHPAWFAREGYCCLILDTLQLGEIEGLHHGTYREGMWWWPARGYTPAGVEAWNAVRALDYLETRPEVDMKRIGVTGRSGGGAYTWWLAGIDDRPACLIPVAGITDLENHVVDGCIEGHCDCMYMVNTYQWDFPTLAALAAPRPLLFSNSDKDTIFPLDGVVRTHAKLKKIYELYGAKDKLGLLITEGPHKDTQELQVPAFRWMNRWLQNRDTPITRVADKPLDPKLLKVFDALPADQRNTTVHEWFVAQAQPPAPPGSREEWEPLRDKWLAELKEKSFRTWPDSPTPLDTKCIAEKEANDLKLQVIEFTSEENVRLPIYVFRAAKFKDERASSIHVQVLDSERWNEWLNNVGFIFGESIPGGGSINRNEAAFEEIVNYAKQFNIAFAAIAPRGTCLNRWDADKKKDTHIQRRFTLLGNTTDEKRVWDVYRAVQALKSRDELNDSKVLMLGAGRAAGIAFYAGLFRSDVFRFDLHELPTSHRDGPYCLNILRVVDMPQAVALALPRRVVIYDTMPDAWRWTDAVAKLYASGEGFKPFSAFEKETDEK